MFKDVKFVETSGKRKLYVFFDNSGNRKRVFTLEFEGQERVIKYDEFDRKNYNTVLCFYSLNGCYQLESRRYSILYLQGKARLFKLADYEVNDFILVQERF
jgi:hypothetical protein